MATKTYTLSELAKYLSAEMRGDPNCVITGIGALKNAKVGHISFLENPTYRNFLETTRASAVIIREEHASAKNKNFLFVDNPYLGYARITALFDDTPKSVPGIHHTAVIGEECDIDVSATIGPYCVIGNRVKIGKNVKIESGTVVGEESEIGTDSRLCANVTLYHKVKIGQRTIIHSGVVIGSDGFGNVNENGHWCKIYQLGGVSIGNDVEIGANTTIDRGSIDDTIIEDGVRLDNQIQIAHNVFIGAHTAIAGCVGIAGSTKIGRHCMIGGGVGITGHVTIADGVIVTAGSSIAKSITTPGIYSSGLIALPHRSWWRIFARITHIEDLVNRIAALEKKNEHN